MNAFQEALLDAVLEEYAVLAQPPKTVADGTYTLWVDQPAKRVSLSRHESCMRLLFSQRQKAAACLHILLLQGYFLGA